MKNEKNSDMELEVLIQKAQELKQWRAKFRIVRNKKNLETGEIEPGKLEFDWQIINIDNQGLVTLCNSKNEVFHIQIQELAKINQDLFNL